MSFAEIDLTEDEVDDYQVDGHPDLTEMEGGK